MRIILLLLLLTVNAYAVPFGTGIVPSGTSPPATCRTGELFLDTNADTDGSLFHCVATDTWKEVDDDGTPGAGDVSSVADCSSGDCLDGSSDGGTNIRLYDGDSNYGQFSIPDISSDVTYTFPSATSTIPPAPVAEAFGSGWNADTGAPQKNDIHDWAVLFDTDLDGDPDDETWTPTRIQLKLDQLTGAPGSPVDGDIYLADGIIWDPAGLGIAKAYYVGYDGSNYIALFDEDFSWYLSALEIPNGTDPDLTAEGQISHDTDGANETGDVVLRGYDTAQFAWERKLKCINATVVAPNDLADATRDLLPIFHNTTGMTYTITSIEAWSETDSMEVTVKEYTEEDFSSASNTIDVVNTGTTGTSVSHVIETTISHAAIEANNMIVLDFDDTDDPAWFKLTICGWYNADVD